MSLVVRHEKVMKFPTPKGLMPWTARIEKILAKKYPPDASRRSALPFDRKKGELAMVRGWVYDPHSGGVPIPKAVQVRVRNRILWHAEKNYAGKYNRIDVRFRGRFCYIDAYTEPYVPKSYNPKVFGESRAEHIERLRNTPTHLCRLRYFGDENRWSMAFYTYSHERYEPCFFDNGSWHGTPEEAFDTSAVYLTG